MEPFHWPPGLGPNAFSVRTVRQVYEMVLPREAVVQASAFLRAASGVRRAQDLMRNLESSLDLRDTIADFLLMVFVHPARQGRGVPGFMDRVQESADRGLPLIMIPDKDLLLHVVDTGSYAEGAAVLFDARDEIAPRCQVMLKGDLPRGFAPAAGETLRRVRPIAVDAAKSFIDGRYIGAQATATAVLDTLLAKILGAHMDSLSDKKKSSHTSVSKLLRSINEHVPPDHPDRALALKLIIPPAMQAFQEAASDMDEYNRHATIHRVSSRQYTPENALIALMHMSAVFVLLRCVGPGGLPPGPTQAV